MRCCIGALLKTGEGVSHSTLTEWGKHVQCSGEKWGTGTMVEEGVYVVGGDRSGSAGAKGSEGKQATGSGS